MPWIVGSLMTSMRMPQLSAQRNARTTAVTIARKTLMTVAIPAPRRAGQRVHAATSHQNCLIRPTSPPCFSAY